MEALLRGSESHILILKEEKYNLLEMWEAEAWASVTMTMHLSAWAGLGKSTCCWLDPASQLTLGTTGEVVALLSLGLLQDESTVNRALHTLVRAVVGGITCAVTSLKPLVP